MVYILFDIGGTKTRIGVSFDGKRLGKVKIIPTSRDAKGGIAVLKSIAEELTGGKKIKAICGGIAGSFDRRKSVIVGGGGNIKGWVGKPLKVMLERKFHASVYLENDAALTGLGEAVCGAGRGKEIIAYFTISTGFGGVRVVKDKIDASARGFEPTYLIIDIGGKLCRKCRGKDIGAHLSGKGIFEHFHKDPKKIKGQKIKNNLALFLAIGLHNAIAFWSPDIFVIGGPVMNIISMDRVRTHLKKLYHGALPPPPIKKAALGDFGSLHGALIYLQQQRMKKNL